MNQEKLHLSIIICTYNREKLLRQIIESLFKQINDHPECELLVLDNNSSDDTAQVVENFKNQVKNLRYIFEPEPGLSSARNRGLREAAGDYVGYIDDDCIALPGWITTALNVIADKQPNIFGGPYTPWYETPKPKWLDASYGTKTIGNSQKYLDRGYLSGGNIFFKRKLLLEMGGFDPALGMKENTLGFGEETRLQVLLREKYDDPQIYYHPGLMVKHRVAEEKTRIGHMVMRRFISGTYSARALKKKNEKEKPPLVLLGDFVITSVRIIYTFTIKTILRNKKKYPYAKTYWVNVGIRLFGILGKYYGELIDKKNGD